MSMKITELLQKHQKKIRTLLSKHPAATYGRVRIMGAQEPENFHDEPALDVLVSFDEHDQEHPVDVIVCIRTMKPGKPVGYSFGADLKLMQKLEALLGCGVTFCDQRGLETGYPVTFSKTLPTHAWDMSAWKQMKKKR